MGEDNSQNEINKEQISNQSVVPPIDRSKFKRQEVTRQPVSSESKKVETISFEEWYSMQEKNIPSHHHREILKADFKGQGIIGEATKDQFDMALKKYGVDLK